MLRQSRLVFINTLRRRLLPCAVPATCLLAAISSMPPIAAGAPTESSIPSWVPVYPGAKVGALRSQPGSAESYSWFKITTRDPCGRVWRFYDEQLKLAGFSVVYEGLDPDGCQNLRAHTAGGTREINLSGGVLVDYSGGNPVRSTRYEVELVQRGNVDRIARPGDRTSRDGSSSGLQIPSWVPSYPRSAPKNFTARQSGPERFVSFSFTSQDDARRILSWYQDNLKQLGFTVSMDVVGTNGLLRSNTRDNSRSLKIEVSAAGAQNVVLLEIRDGK